STGNAWLIGVLAGLLDAGLDVTTADLTIGTSAGATAAAQIAGASPTALFAATMAAAPRQQPGRAGSDRGRAPGRPVANHLERTSRIIADAKDPADMRRRLGAAALDLDAASDGSFQGQWRATVASRLPSDAWPERAMPKPANRSCSTATAASTSWTRSPPAVPAAFPTGSVTAATSTAATDPTR